MNAIAELEAFLRGYKFVWLGYDAVSCIGLARHMRFDLIICTRYGLDSDWAALRAGAELISPERETGERPRHLTCERMLQGELGPRIVSAFGEQPRSVVSSSSTETLEALATASDGNLRILAVPLALKRTLDSKIALRQALPGLGIEPLPHVVCGLTAVSFRAMEQRYASPFVVQLATGSAGSGTFFVFSESELQSLQGEHGEQEVTVSPYVHGLAPNINAVVLDDRVLLSHPSIQVVGVPQCTGWPSRYCGNDFGAAQRLSRSVIESIYGQTRKIGAWIGGQGFRGLWGIDFVVHRSRVYPLEVNPRFQGSTRLLTDLQHMQDRVPLWLAHVVGRLDGGQAFLQRLGPQCWEPQPLLGSQLEFRNRAGETRVVRGRLGPGVYRWSGAQGIYQRKGLSVADCRTEDEFVVTSSVPRINTQVEPETFLCKIQTPREVLDTASNKLQPWAERLCDWVYDALALL
jgi:hypothetical protein